MLIILGLACETTLETSTNSSPIPRMREWARSDSCAKMETTRSRGELSHHAHAGPRRHTAPLRDPAHFSVGLSFCKTFICGSPYTLVTCNPSQCTMIGKYENATVGEPIEFTVTVPSSLVKPTVKATGRTAH